MSRLLFRAEREDRWIAGLRESMPELEVEVWPNVSEPGRIDYVLAWQPPQELFDGLTGLKAIFSIGAGVDHLLGDLRLPDNIPVVRMTDVTLTEGITDYVLYNVLKFHRGFHHYDERSARGEWQQHPQIRNADRRVGIMGLGVLGTDAAMTLASRGFDVAGWSRSPKTIEGVTSYAGADALNDFLARSEILVCLLPLTADTADILNDTTLAALPKGACVINAARGGHLDTDALTRALDSGQIKAAALDVFKEEPLPESSGLWSDSRIVITPHAASLTLPETAAAKVAENIRLIESGKMPDDLADLSRGY